MSLLIASLFLRSRYRLSLTVGDSMAPTLQSGDLLVVDLQAYRRAQPQRGDLVVATHRSGKIVKRIVGLPGETVEVRVGRLYVEGSEMAETYLAVPGTIEVGSGRLAAGRYALLGDNRALAPGQATHAVVGTEDLLGRVVLTLRLWPSGTRTEAPPNMGQPSDQPGTPAGMSSRVE